MTASHDNAELSARLPRQRSDKVNILLVDDQPARLLSYETILGELGQNLICARSGVEALARLMKDEFALVLLDVSMPGMDGFETAAMIHDHPRFERTPIIFVTGVHDTEFDRLKGYKLGAVDYVSIPVVPEILRSKVVGAGRAALPAPELQQLNRSLADANEQLEQANTTLQAEKTRELEARTASAERQHGAGSVEPSAAGRDRRARARRGGADRSRPAQGRVPRDPGARAAQSAGADPQRRRDHVALAARQPAAAVVARRHRPPGAAPDAAGRRPARRLAHHARHDQAGAGAGAQSRRSSRAPSRRCSR